MFGQGVRFGQIGVAHLIFDHHSGEALRTRGRPATPAGCKKKAEKNIDNIGDKEIESESEKTGHSFLNLSQLSSSVKLHAKM